MSKKYVFKVLHGTHEHNEQVSEDENKKPIFENKIYKAGDTISTDQDLHSQLDQPGSVNPRFELVGGTEFKTAPAPAVKVAPKLAPPTKKPG